MNAMLGSKEEAILVGDDGKPVRWDHNPIAGLRNTFIRPPTENKLGVFEIVAGGSILVLVFFSFYGFTTVITQSFFK